MDAHLFFRSLSSTSRRSLFIACALSLFGLDGVYAENDPNPKIAPEALIKQAPLRRHTSLMRELALISIHVNDPLTKDNLALTN